MSFKDKLIVVVLSIVFVTIFVPFVQVYGLFGLLPLSAVIGVYLFKFSE